jgi:hypothetical protein
MGRRVHSPVGEALEELRNKEDIIKRRTCQTGGWVVRNDDGQRSEEHAHGAYTRKKERGECSCEVWGESKA